MAIVVSIIFCLAFLFAMLGLGGAMIYIPVLSWFGYDFKSVAIPTGLFLNGVTALSAAVYYLRAGMVDVRGALPAIVMSFIGAPLGAWFTHYVSTETLIILFAIGMLVAATRMWFNAGQGEAKALRPVATRALITGVAGLFIGFLAGLLGIGGGFLFVPLLIAIGYPTKQAAATSAFIVIFSSFSGFAGHAAEGHYHWPLLLASTIAVAVAAQLGAKIMKEKVKAQWIKRAFSLVLLFVAAKLTWGVVF